MFLEALKERNPALLQTAVKWHQDGVIPASCWLIDLDTIAGNADILNRAKIENGLQTYVMSKQYARNPFVTLTALRRGLHAIVCVDIQCARLARRYGVKVGHVGHLNQIPKRDIPFVLALEPEVWTVYTLEQAQAISDEAGKIGITQNIMMRIFRPGDVFFTGQEGGFPFDQYEKAAAAIAKMPHVRLTGVTSFPCLNYNSEPGEEVAPTENLRTITMAAKRLHEMGFDITQINAPGNTSSFVFPLLKAGGATHVEPGHGLLGTTMPHHFRRDLPEAPAYCFVSEISHHYNGMAYAFGGGLFKDVTRKDFHQKALVGTNWESMKDNACSVVDIPQIIDYHAPLTEGEKCRVGDTALFGFRTQMHMTRALIAVAGGIHEGKPRLLGLFDGAGTMLDPVSFEPVEEARARVEDALQTIG